ACGEPLGPARLAYRGLLYRRCAACGARALATIPTDAELRLHYETAYPRMFTPSRIGTPRREMLAGVLAQARRQTAPGRLLDVGCGSGHFLSAAQSDGWRGVGTDLSHAAAASALARLGPLARLRGLDAFPIVHVFAFGRGALVRLLTGAGFDVVDVINSDLAGAPGGGAGRALGAAVRTLAALAAAASRGRWLLGPSLEVYAKRR